MKKSLLLFITIICGLNVNSQIIITNSDMPNGGDTALVSISNQFTDVDVNLTGANYTWDFSFLTPNTQRVDTFFNVNSASVLYQVSFNNFITAPDYNSDYYNKLVNNNLPEVPGGIITLDKPVFFTKNSSSKSEIVGIGVEINGIEIPVQADTIDVVYEFPMTFNDAWTSDSYLFMDMNPAFNAMFKRNQSRTSDVDGWGEITTNFGTFNAIRVKSIIDFTDSIYVDLGFGGIWTSIPTPQEIEYTWWTNNNKIPVLKIITRLGVPTIIEYRDSEIDDTGLETELINNDFLMFPNPTSEKVELNFNSNYNSIKIIDVTGKVIFNKDITNSNIALINTQNWDSGLYIVKLIGNNTISTKSLIIK